MISWLKRNDLHDLEEIFKKNQIDGKTLSELNEYWLTEMGIDNAELVEKTLIALKNASITTESAIAKKTSSNINLSSSPKITEPRSKSDGYCEGILREKRQSFRPSSEIITSNIQNFFPSLEKMPQRSSLHPFNSELNGEIGEINWIKGSLIGFGSFGRVFLGINLVDGEMIAAKQIPWGKKQGISNVEKEMNLLRKLKHKNIVRYLGANTSEDCLTIFLEYIPGGSIQMLLKENGPVDVDLTAYLSRQILEGLDYLHSMGIVHKDIKGANMLLDEKGTVKIADFGLADNFTTENSSELQGTIFWLAPEVVSARKYSPSSDIWSFGCTVLEMLSGDHPWASFNKFQALFRIGQGEAPPITIPVGEFFTSIMSQCFNK